MNVELDLIDLKCRVCGSTKVSMESLMNNLRCRDSCNEFERVEGKISIKVSSAIGTIEVL